MPLIYAFPGNARPENTSTNYLAVVGAATLWSPSARKTSLADLGDGTSNTILVVENQGEGIHWMEPRDLRFDAMDPSFNSARGISSPYVAPAVVTVDGEIHRLKPTLSAETLRALLTPNGGEILERDAASGWVTLPDGRLRGLAKNSSPDR